MFTRDQLSAWLGINRRTARRFVRDMLDRRLAAEDRLAGRKVCRISARAVYRALGAKDIRHRRIASAQVLLRRLLSLDYVIGHTGLPWLPTEPEKVGAFEALGLERSILPVRVYRGVGGETRRYFPLKLPVALDAGGAMFVYADPGHDTATALHSWGRAHRELWGALRERDRPVEGRRGRPERRGVRAGREGPRQLDLPGPFPRPLDGIRDRPPDPAARSTGSNRPSAAWDESVIQAHGSLQGCLARDRRTQGRAPDRARGSDDRRLHGMAFDPAFAGSVLTAGSGCRCRSTSAHGTLGVAGHEIAHAMGTPPIPYVAGALAVVPRPAERRCRSRAPWTWLGATPHLGMPRSASGRMAMGIPIVPSAAGSLPASSPSGKGVGPMRPWTLLIIGVALTAATVRAFLAPFPGIGGNPVLDLIAYHDPGLHTAIHVWYYAAPAVALLLAGSVCLSVTRVWARAAYPARRSRKAARLAHLARRRGALARRRRTASSDRAARERAALLARRPREGALHRRPHRGGRRHRQDHRLHVPLRPTTALLAGRRAWPQGGRARARSQGRPSATSTTA